ncbi:MAG: hypothetical protein AB1801_26365, partial [Chloroflexota bacterium]
MADPRRILTLLLSWTLLLGAACRTSPAAEVQTVSPTLAVTPVGVTAALPPTPLVSPTSPPVPSLTATPAASPTPTPPATATPTLFQPPALSDFLARFDLPTDRLDP